MISPRLVQEPRVRMSLVMEELQRRTIVNWDKALADCGDSMTLTIEQFMDNGCSALFDAWARAIEQHQPDYQNAQNAAATLRVVASVLRQMAALGETYRIREDAEYEGKKKEDCLPSAVLRLPKLVCRLEDR